jgi:hypothetical protein
MSKEQHDKQQSEQKGDAQWDSRSLVQKRLIWQHLAQKKIKKALRSKVWTKVRGTLD